MRPRLSHTTTLPSQPPQTNPSHAPSSPLLTRKPPLPAVRRQPPPSPPPLSRAHLALFAHKPSRLHALFLLLLSILLPPTARTLAASTVGGGHQQAAGEGQRRRRLPAYKGQGTEEASQPSSGAAYASGGKDDRESGGGGEPLVGVVPEEPRGLRRRLRSHRPIRPRLHLPGRAIPAPPPYIPGTGAQVEDLEKPAAPELGRSGAREGATAAGICVGLFIVKERAGKIPTLVHYTYIGNMEKEDKNRGEVEEGKEQKTVATPVPDIVRVGALHKHVIPDNRFHALIAYIIVVGLLHHKDNLMLACNFLAVPPWLTKITERICQWTGLFPSAINHVLINEYHPNQGIMPHQDGPAYFPVVAIISLASPVVLDFTPHGKLRGLEHTYPQNMQYDELQESKGSYRVEGTKVPICGNCQIWRRDTASQADNQSFWPTVLLDQILVKGWCHLPMNSLPI